jgi:hypothetical protein
MTETTTSEIFPDTPIRPPFDPDLVPVLDARPGGRPPTSRC